MNYVKQTNFKYSNVNNIKCTLWNSYQVLVNLKYNYFELVGVAYLFV